MYEKKLKIVALRISEELDKELETMMQKERRSKSDVIRIILEDKIKEYCNQEGRTM